MSNCTYNLGQLNVDVSMDSDPTFESLAGLEVDIGEYHYETILYWPSSDGRGWHNLFKFEGDGIDISDDPETDLVYYTEPQYWLLKDDGTYMNIIEDGITISNFSSNALSGNPDDSIAKDFLRHIANEVMGGYSSGAKLGVLDIFDNENELLDDIHSKNSIIYNKHINILNIARGDISGVPNVDEFGFSLGNKERSTNNIPHGILTKMLNTGGFSRITEDLLAGLDVQVEAETIDISVNVVSGAFIFPSLYDNTHNPTITLIKGKKYSFNLDLSGSGHGFNVQIDSSLNGTLYTNGISYDGSNSIVYGSDSHGNSDGKFIFNVPIDISNEKLYYVCSNHSNMYGTFIFKNENKTEILKAGDGLSFVLTINPSCTINSVTRYTINPIKYKVTIIMQTAYVSTITNTRNALLNNYENDLFGQYTFYNSLPPDIVSDVFSDNIIQALTAEETAELDTVVELAKAINYFKNIFTWDQPFELEPDQVAFPGAYKVKPENFIDASGNQVPYPSYYILKFLYRVFPNIDYSIGVNYVDFIINNCNFKNWQKDRLTHTIWICKFTLYIKSNSDSMDKMIDYIFDNPYFKKTVDKADADGNTYTTTLPINDTYEGEAYVSGSYVDYHQDNKILQNWSILDAGLTNYTKLVGISNELANAITDRFKEIMTKTESVNNLPTYIESLDYLYKTYDSYEINYIMKFYELLKNTKPEKHGRISSILRSHNTDKPSSPYPKILEFFTTKNSIFSALDNLISTYETFDYDNNLNQLDKSNTLLYINILLKSYPELSQQIKDNIINSIKSLYKSLTIESIVNTNSNRNILLQDASNEILPLVDNSNVVISLFLNDSEKNKKIVMFNDIFNNKYTLATSIENDASFISVLKDDYIIDNSSIYINKISRRFYLKSDKLNGYKFVPYENLHIINTNYSDISGYDANIFINNFNVSLDGNNYVIDDDTNTFTTLTLKRGNTYNFNLNVTGFPFRIIDDSNNLYSNSLTHEHNGNQLSNENAQDKDTGVLRFYVEQYTPDTLYYLSLTSNSNMLNKGTINIIDDVNLLDSTTLEINSNTLVSHQYTDISVNGFDIALQNDTLMLSRKNSLYKLNFIHRMPTYYREDEITEKGSTFNDMYKGDIVHIKSKEIITWFDKTDNNYNFNHNYTNTGKLNLVYNQQNNLPIIRVPSDTNYKLIIDLSNSKTNNKSLLGNELFIFAVMKGNNVHNGDVLFSSQKGNDDKVNDSYFGFCPFPDINGGETKCRYGNDITSIIELKLFNVFESQYGTKKVRYQDLSMSEFVNEIMDVGNVGQEKYSIHYFSASQTTNEMELKRDNRNLLELAGISTPLAWNDQYNGHSDYDNTVDFHLRGSKSSDIYICEIVVFNKFLSINDRNIIYDYLNKKWNIDSSNINLNALSTLNSYKDKMFVWLDATDVTAGNDVIHTINDISYIENQEIYKLDIEDTDVIMNIDDSTDILNYRTNTDYNSIDIPLYDAKMNLFFHPNEYLSDNFNFSYHVTNLLDVQTLLQELTIILDNSGEDISNNPTLVNEIKENIIFKLLPNNIGTINSVDEIIKTHNNYLLIDSSNNTYFSMSLLVDLINDLYKDSNILSVINSIKENTPEQIFSLLSSDTFNIYLTTPESFTEYKYGTLIEYSMKSNKYVNESWSINYFIYKNEQIAILDNILHLEAITLSLDLIPNYVPDNSFNDVLITAINLVIYEEYPDLDVSLNIQIADLSYSDISNNITIDLIIYPLVYI